MDVYENSVVLSKLRLAQREGQPLRLAYMDIDETWTGEPADQQAVRDLLESNNYAIVQITSRGSEQCMSWNERDKSAPNISGRMLTVDPAADPTAQGLLDTDGIIGTSGTELLLKQKEGGYIRDEQYYERLPESIESWQQIVNQFLKEAIPAELSRDIIEIWPLKFRIEIDLKTEGAAEQLLQYLIQQPTASPFYCTRDRCNIFITPPHTSKKAAVNYLTDTLVEKLDIEAKDLQVLIAGDSMADFEVGLQAAAGTQATFIIPGGASLYEELLTGALQSTYQQMTKSQNGGTLPPGVYWFKGTNRKIVVGTEAFLGTIGPQTLSAWLTKHA